MGYQANYHTHTWRCHHASGEAVDYVRAAQAGGCPVIGISDHTPTPDGRWGEMRMALEDLDGYEAAVAEARVAYPAITVLQALECEYVPEFLAFYQDELLGRRGYDYLIGAPHYTIVNGIWRSSFDRLVDASSLRAYAAICAQAMASGLFAFIAHPDLIGCCNPRWTPDTAACARDICAASAATGVPLELNAYGLRKPWISADGVERPTYPWDPFWIIASEAGATVVLNSDAHRPEDTCAGYDELVALRDRFGLREVVPSVQGLPSRDRDPGPGSAP